MNKTVYKIRPSDYWRIREHECWLADMAAEGFHLKKMGIHFAKFDKGEPKKTKYRIDVSIKKKIRPDQIRMYSEYGWDYVTSYGSFHVFSSPEELNAPEPHTDPAKQSYTLEELDMKFSINAGIVAVSSVILFAMLWAIWFLDGTPTFVLVEGMAIPQTLLAVFLGYSTYKSIQAASSIRALRKKLTEGEHIDHNAPWKKHNRLHSAAAFLFTAIIGLSAIISLIQLVKMDTKTLPEASLDLPIVRLADVEKNPALVRGEPSYESDSADWANRYSYHWSPLAPVQYKTDEHGLVPGEMWEDGSGQYSPSIYTEVYQLIIPALSDNLISDLIEKKSFGVSRDDIVEMEHPALDLLFVNEEKDVKRVFAFKGKSVMYVMYHGDADIDSVIENAAEKIMIISD